MQLIWVSGPTARVVTISITARKVVAAFALLALGFVGLGFVFNLIGLRVAVEFSPELVQRVGGVASQAEFDRAQQSYRAQLQALDAQLTALSTRMQALESTKNTFLERLGIERLLRPSSTPPAPSAAGQGGPMRWLPLMPGGADLSQRLAASAAQVQQLEQRVQGMQRQWESDLGRLDRVPAALPLLPDQDFQVTSGFGFRLDPFNHLPSMHEGIDFVAPVGTPVRVTAQGVVIRSEHAGAYGEYVDVQHEDGFVTRYAHLSARQVREGESLRRGDIVGLLGNTGRSSGPHLHYEVIYQGRAMHPARALAAWSRR